jgi:hypothetical protein
MPHTVRLVACLALLAAASPARAGFITYAFASDSADRGGALTGSFRVDDADLLDGILSTDDVRDYQFTFTDPSGGTTVYTLGGVLPDLNVDPVTGIPLAPPAGLGGSVLGDAVGGVGAAQAFLTSEALTPGASFWVALGATGETDGGVGHWEIAPEVVSPVPAPAGLILGLVGVGCLTIRERVRRRGAGARG